LLSRSSQLGVADRGNSCQFGDAPRRPTAAQAFCRDLGTRPELRIPNVAAQRRIVSVAEIRTGPRNAAASLRPRLRGAQVRRHFAIVGVLLVARLAAEPLLGGAERPAPDVVARVRWRRCQRHREYLLQIRILHRCRCYCTLVAARRARSSRYAFTNCDKADGSTSASLF